MILLISSKQRLACDYYGYEKSVLREILETRTYYKNVSGVACSHNRESVIPIKNGKAQG